jgi:uncharacterized protein (TIGR00369 family)
MEVFKQRMDKAALQLPPPTLLELGARFTDYLPGVSLTIEVPFQLRFTNPVGSYQGGMFAAALDEAFGPLSYLTAEAPCVTLDMAITYLKTFQAVDKVMLVKAEVVRKTSQFVFMRAEIRNPQGELLVMAQSHSTILKERPQ